MGHTSHAARCAWNVAKTLSRQALCWPDVTPHPAFAGFVISPQTGRPVPLPPPPPPTGWASLAPVGLMLGIWAAGLVVAALVWWALGRPKNDAQPDA